jgi:isoquinoline 1-oxidoreductase beta subunit
MPHDRPSAASRRNFLKGSAALGAGLVIGFRWPLGRMDALAQGAAPKAPPPADAFLRIAPDNTVTVLCKHLEFGQGPYTGVATIVADELDADHAQIRVEAAPADVKLYGNNAWGGIAQGTGGSTAIANSWEELRRAGAEARARLVAAAAETWGVKRDEITIENGVARHASGRTASFGQLAERARSVTLASTPQPKDPSRWRYIGKEFAKVDTREKVDGSAVYTLDVKLPDMLTCVVAHPPRFGAKMKSFDSAAAMKVRGVVEVVAIPQGVAVLARGFWPAKKGRDALTIQWDETGAEKRGTDALLAEFTKLAEKPGTLAKNEGDARAAIGKAARVVEATYVFPYLAHAPMEPNDCVIRRTGNGVELLFGSQIQTVDQAMAAQVLGLKPEQVAIRTLLAGGSFGRRATPHGDMAQEAAEVLKASKHAGPIKVVWTREDDIQGGRYRPLMVHRIRGAVDDKGAIAGWEQVVVGQSFLKGSPFEGMIKNNIDPTMTEGADNLPYAVPNLHVSAHVAEVGVPTLWWRSVGHTHTAFATETFFDELAMAAGADPLDMRRRLLKDHPRLLGVLNLAAERAGWGARLPQGRALGVAIQESFHTYVAQVAEVSKGEDGLPKVHRVVCAVDCGIAVNPDVIRAQMEGGIGYGLSAALFSAIDLKDGNVVQSNFHDYRTLRIHEMPRVEVHIVPSPEKPTGVGEPGVPPIAPAVANAWMKLTGQRIHRLPFIHAVA